jgi:hypothetical protein
MLDGEGNLVYRHVDHPVRLGSIGNVNLAFEDLVVTEEPPPSYWDEIVAWCQDHSIKETIQFTPVRNPKFGWTSEQFNFAIEVSKPKMGVFTMTQLYLIDYFEGPPCNALQSASTHIGAPKVLALLRKKLFRMGPAGIKLKSKYRSWPNLEVHNKIPIPLTSHLVRAIQRRFYFNRSFWSEEGPGTYSVGFHCVYALLSPTVLESIPQRLTNLINTGNPDQCFDERGATGPSWFCTLNYLLQRSEKSS